MYCPHFVVTSHTISFINTHEKIYRFRYDADGSNRHQRNHTHCHDTQPVRLLYGPNSKVGLNIMRMEISPSFQGEGWGDYNWHGSLPSAQLVKQRGGIVFGTPWSPPGEYKTNGTAQGGNSDSQGKKRGELREDCYAKFFPWLNTFLKYMKMNGVKVDAVSIQNEPDWWVDYSGCLYTPEQQVKLVKEHADKLDRKTYKGVRLISADTHHWAT